LFRGKCNVRKKEKKKRKKGGKKKGGKKDDAGMVVVVVVAVVVVVRIPQRRYATPRRFCMSQEARCPNEEKFFALFEPSSNARWEETRAFFFFFFFIIIIIIVVIIIVVTCNDFFWMGKIGRARAYVCCVCVPHVREYIVTLYICN